ncbi:MAG: hypothetical protein RIS86_1048 [Planctomycetota bacterium]|jgi:hypothetical protein
MRAQDGYPRGMDEHPIAGRAQDRSQPAVRLGAEREADQSWIWHASIDAPEGSTLHELRLSWADYNVFCPDGARTPAEVGRAVLAFFARHRAEFPLRERLDAAMARMRFPFADRDIAEILAG